MSDELAPFESPRILLDDAKVCIAEIERMSDDFTSDCAGPIRKSHDSSTGETILFITLKKPFPEAIRIRTHHVINNIKHSLDQTVGDAAVLLGRANARGIHFPIGRTVEDFRNEVRQRLKNVDPELVAHIVHLDTNESGNPDLYKFLALSGPNKHQRIVSITTRSGLTLHSSALGAMYGVTGLNIGKWHRRKHEIEWIRLAPNGYIIGRGNLYDILQPSFRIVLKDGLTTPDEVLSATLRKFLSECERIATGIEAETERILAARL